MGVGGVFFERNGQSSVHYTPGAVSESVFDSGGGGLSSWGSGVIIGDSVSGDPFVLYRFTNDAQAGEILEGGALREGVRMAFHPGGGHKPQAVYAMSVNTKKRASLSFDSSFHVRAKKYGVGGNKIRIKFTKGENGFDLLVKNQLDSVVDVTGRNLIPFSIVNNGSSSVYVSIDSEKLTLRKAGANASASSGTLFGVEFSAADGRSYVLNFVPGDTTEAAYAPGVYTITAGSDADLESILEAIHSANPSVSIYGVGAINGEITGSLTLSGGTEAESEEHVFEFEVYKTAAQLCEGITDMGDLEGVVLGGGDFETIHLDAATLKEVKPEEEVRFSANYFDLCSLLIGTGLLTVESTRGNVLPDAIASASPLSGGTNGECTALQYQEALELLKKEDIQLISTTSESESVHLLIRRHCEDCNSRKGRRERQFLVGHALGVQREKVKELAQNLGTQYGAFLSPGFLDYDYTDPLMERKRSYSAAYYACKELGRQISMSPSQPATRKEVSHLGWEVDYGDYDDLIQSGVWAGGKSPEGTYCNIRSVTTCKQNNIMLNEFSVVRSTLYIQRDLRNMLDRNFIGTRGIDQNYSSIKSESLIRIDLYQSMSLLKSWDRESLSVMVEGDTVLVEWDGNPVLPINFIFSTNRYKVYKGEGI